MAIPTVQPSLPPELIHSLQRVLSLQAQPDDPLDDLSPNFNPASSLNNFFPAGAFASFTGPLTYKLTVARLKGSALAPGNIEVVQNRLLQSRADLQADIDRLRVELGISAEKGQCSEQKDGGPDEQGDQNDARMGVIQEVISVRFSKVLSSATYH